VKVDGPLSLVGEGEAHQRSALRVIYAVLLQKVSEQHVEPLLGVVVYPGRAIVLAGCFQAAGPVLVAHPDFEPGTPVFPL
jgi:hypothetical protein